MLFSITYEKITPESAEEGEAAERGFLYEGISFREAMDALRWSWGAYVEADSYPVKNPRWFTFYKTDEDFRTGEVTNLSLHLPESLTSATRARIARLIGCYGV
jgi:hypothetical protein